MKLRFLGFAVAMVTSVSVFAAAKGGECVKRIKEAGCMLTLVDQAQIIAQNMECKQISSESAKTILQVFQKKDGNMVAVETRGVDKCAKVEYDLRDRIEEVLVIDNNKLFMRSGGAVYFMYPDQTMYELLNTDKKSYSSVRDMQGIHSGQAVELNFRNGQFFDVTSQVLEERKAAGMVRPIDAKVRRSGWTLFD